LEKVEAQQQSGGSSPSIVMAEIPEAGSGSNDRMHESLRILNEEALQLSEFFWQEEKMIKELCSLLKQVLRQLNLSFNLPAEVFPPLWKSQRILLNAEAHLILLNDKNEVTSKALEDYPPNIIFSVTSFVIPELSKFLASYRARINTRISFFDRVIQELKSIGKILTDRPKKLESEAADVGDGEKRPVVQQNPSSK
jgi:hypothetical protein